MAQTYSSGEISVSNGDITTHNPRSIVGGNGDIRILSAQARWQGVNRTEEETNTSTDFQTNENTAEINFEQDYEFSFPDASDKPGPDWEFIEHEFVIYHFHDQSHDVELEFWRVEKGSGDNYQTIEEDFSPPIYTLGTDTLNNSANLWSSSTPRDGMRGDIRVRGESRDETSCIDGELFVAARTRFKKTTTTTTTNTYKTRDPYLTRDVDASYSGTLTDGEWSSWSDLTGLEPNVDNEFYHGISSSNRADFQFEFEWEYVAPDPVNGTVGFADAEDGLWRECAVADPSDTLLDYNHVTVYNPETGNWGALDVVDPSDPDAIDGWEFYDPDVGWLAPREYQTTPI